MASAGTENGQIVMTDLEHGRRTRGQRGVQTNEAYAVPPAVGRRHGAAFWAVAFAFLVGTSFVLPTT